jgi:hypothetical protein
MVDYGACNELRKKTYKKAIVEQAVVLSIVLARIYIYKECNLLKGEKANADRENKFCQRIAA